MASPDWIEWTGGECPVPNGTYVALSFRENKGAGRSTSCVPEALNWQHRARAFGGDILGYRILTEAECREVDEDIARHKARSAALLAHAQAARAPEQVSA